MANRLIDETSPYLRQHAHNPVDWYPWGPEALGRARDEDKPILLSIGYSACHWCHVMERESFENPAIAELMNENFVSIKVDREERPDLDSLYMAAVQALTQRGGWPMTVFLTPEGRPFYGGTYFPPSDRGGMPGFPRVLESVATAFKTRRSELEASAKAISAHLSQQLPLGPPEGELSPETLDGAAEALAASFDPRYGGFGGAPKFPQPMTLEFLLRYHARTGDEQSLAMVEQTLVSMMRGGIYDHLGGGFHRYSVDREWLVPHFEKMLYDNAQLARLYLHAYQVTGNAEYRRVVEETLAYVRREMTAPEGGFYSTQDADSEGEEGKFFLWTPDETASVLGGDNARLFDAYYDVSRVGNFEGKSILNVRLADDVVAREQGVTVERLHEVLRDAKARLFEARERRAKPGRDDKVLAAWNGLMLTAFAEAAAVLRDQEYLAVARRAATFVRDGLQRDGRLLRSWKDGEAKLNGYLEDYAMVARGLLALHAAGGGTEWFVWARELADHVLAHFSDEERGGFYDTSDDHEELVSRPKDVTDNATPSGASVAIEVLLMLAALTGDDRYREAAVKPLASLDDLLAREPRFFGYALSAYDLAIADVREVAIVGAAASADAEALLSVCWERFRPNALIAFGDPDAPGVPLLAERPRLDGRATAYVCQYFACQQPVTEPAALAAQLDEAPIQFQDV